MRRWTKEDIDFFIAKFANNSDLYLSKKLGRSLKSISYMAFKLNLKKSKEHISKVSKRLEVTFTKELLMKMYIDEEKSFRTIAKELNVSKGTIEFYIKKYEIPTRGNLDISKKRNFSDRAWSKGLNKETDKRVKNVANSIKKAYKYKRELRISKIEKTFKKSIRDILYDFYIIQGQSFEQIGKIIYYDRKIISELIDLYKIPKRKKFHKISSFKGDKHSQYGRSWEEVRGRDKAQQDKKIVSKAARKCIVKRIANNEIPFRDTKIEVLMEVELKRLKLVYIKQYIVDNKFVCDFCIPDYRIIIECDGDYWHANPDFYEANKLDNIQNKNVRNDRVKNKYLLENGWIVFRFYETDIKQNIELCIARILDKIEELKKVKSPLD